MVGALLLAGCSDGGSQNEATDSQNNGDVNDAGQPTNNQDHAGAEPMTVADAAALNDGSVATVSGFLIEDSGVLFIADLIAESYPPQPGGATMEVDGIDISGLASVNQEGPVRWLDAVVTVSGTVNSGRLTSATVIDG